MQKLAQEHAVPESGSTAKLDEPEQERAEGRPNTVGSALPDNVLPLVWRRVAQRPRVLDRLPALLEPWQIAGGYQVSSWIFYFIICKLK